MFYLFEPLEYTMSPLWVYIAYATQTWVDGELNVDVSINQSHNKHNFQPQAAPFKHLACKGHGNDITGSGENRTSFIFHFWKVKHMVNMSLGL